MNNRIYEWTVTNTSTGRVAFDDVTLDQQKGVTVYRLTNDILSGWRQGKLLIKPDPSDAIPGLKSIFVLDPCQLPLPVRLIGSGTITPESNALAEGAPIVVVMGTRVQVASSDRRRRVLRVKNIGTQTVWLGGNAVTDANSLIPVAPGEIYTERDVPTAAWWAYVAANLANEDSTLLLQHVYAGTV